MKKLVLGLAVALTLSTLAVGCTNKGTDSSVEKAASDSASVPRQEEQSEQKKVVGIVVKTLTGNSFQIDLAKACEAAAERYGFDFETLAPQTLGDNSQQIDIVENLITKNVDLIVIAASDKTSVSPVLEKAMQSGIPVVTIDTRIDNPNGYITFIGPDNMQAAYQVTKYICDKMGGKGKFVHIEGDPTHEVAQLRKEGCLKALEEYPEVELVASQAANWTHEGGLTVMENALQANPDIAGVFCANDDAALGAIEACKAKGVRPFIAGFDAIELANDAIRAGDLDATVAFFPTVMADAAMRAGSAYINYLNDGKLMYLREWIDSTAQVITPENVDQMPSE